MDVFQPRLPGWRPETAQDRSQPARPDRFSDHSVYWSNSVQFRPYVRAGTRRPEEHFRQPAKKAEASPFAGALEVVDDLPRAWLPPGNPNPQGSGPMGAFCGSLARPDARCMGIEDRLRLLFRPPHRTLPADRSDRDAVPS